MKSLLRSHVLLSSIVLSLSGILSFWGLKTDRCFELNVSEQVEIRAGCNSKVLNIAIRRSVYID